MQAQGQIIFMAQSKVKLPFHVDSSVYVSLQYNFSHQVIYAKLSTLQKNFPPPPYVFCLVEDNRVQKVLRITTLHCHSHRKP